MQTYVRQLALTLLSLESKSFPLFNRCIPQTPEGCSLFASVLVNDVDALHRILRGIMSGRDTILGLCILSLGLSLAMVFTFRFITTLLVHTFIALVILGLLCSSACLDFCPEKEKEIGS